MKTLSLLAVLTLSLFAHGSLSFAQECDDDSLGRCAEVSLEKNGYVTSDCQKVKTIGQDLCAAASLKKNGYVVSDCFAPNVGGMCAEVSLEKLRIRHVGLFKAEVSGARPL